MGLIEGIVIFLLLAAGVLAFGIILSNYNMRQDAESNNSGLAIFDKEDEPQS